MQYDNIKSGVSRCEDDLTTNRLRHNFAMGTLFSGLKFVKKFNQQEKQDPLAECNCNEEGPDPQEYRHDPLDKCTQYSGEKKRSYCKFIREIC